MLTLAKANIVQKGDKSRGRKVKRKKKKEKKKEEKKAGELVSTSCSGVSSSRSFDFLEDSAREHTTR